MLGLQLHRKLKEPFGITSKQEPGGSHRLLRELCEQCVLGCCPSQSKAIGTFYHLEVRARVRLRCTGGYTEQ